MASGTLDNRHGGDLEYSPAASATARSARLLKWLEEFDGPCSEARSRTLATQLGAALETYMGIDREVLTAAFLAEYQERQEHR